ncbi:MAG: DUF2129 domain-containing protein [Acholeplasmataceae bacterium]|nr:DUF2129 domain-containing protein [Acholeplasmataceae bacterium]
MYAKRMAFVVFYQGKQVPAKLKSMPVDIAYQSEKQNYAIVYGDADQEQNFKKQLKDVKGFKYFGPSQTFDENVNF